MLKPSIVDHIFNECSISRVKIHISLLPLINFIFCFFVCLFFMECNTDWCPDRMDLTTKDNPQRHRVQGCERPILSVLTVLDKKVRHRHLRWCSSRHISLTGASVVRGPSG